MEDDGEIKLKKSFRDLAEKNTDVVWLEDKTMAAFNAVEELETFIPDKRIIYKVILLKSFKMDFKEFKKSKLFALIKKMNIYSLNITLFGNFKIATLLLETCRPSEVRLTLMSHLDKDANLMVKFKEALLGCGPFDRLEYICRATENKKGFDFKFLKKLKIGVFRYNFVRTSNHDVVLSELKRISKMSHVEYFMICGKFVNASSKLIAMVYGRLPSRMKCQELKIADYEINENSNYKEALVALKECRIPFLDILWILEKKRGDQSDLNRKLRDLASELFPKRHILLKPSRSSFEMKMTVKDCKCDFEESD